MSKVPPAGPVPGGAVCGLTHSSNAGGVGVSGEAGTPAARAGTSL
ncbi:exported hypothetical protein [Cupriavidus phytorum]|uniref:Uncharacterized protein n=1 Tax=Cupriavidus taiwanensis TaxID=164546 RepID=A0A375BCM2_9BURK|nr:exported hypothetical protein [Cupriavidus taiwanensis]